MKCVIFDLDGTLADTSGDLLAAANTCFSDLGLDTALTKDDAPTALKGGRQMLKLGFSRVGIDDEGLVNASYPKLLSAYENSIDQHTFFYEGALDAVKTLAAQGYGVGIATNKPEYLAQKLLVNLGVRDLFGALVGADTLNVHKPNPEHLFETIRRLNGDPKRSLLVGDTKTDFDTAQNADTPCILVDFGPNKDELPALEPKHTISHFNELIPSVERIIATHSK